MQNIDLLIANGLIVDGTGAAPRRGSVAVAADRIVAVGELPPATVAANTIDAHGSLICPGFVDIHTHSDVMVVSHPELNVNGKPMQSGNTRTMIFSVPDLISYISFFMRLEPGDVITTGTPAGVGLGMKPPVYLKPDDVIELGITGLGRQQHIVIRPPESCSAM